MTLSREQILAADDLPSGEIDVPEWGGPVRVRGLTAAERDAFEASIMTMRAGAEPTLRWQNARASLVARCVVDEAGERVFADADVIALGAKSAVAVNRVFELAQRLSGLAEEDVEELVEAFAPAQAGASSSG